MDAESHDSFFQTMKPSSRYAFLRFALMAATTHAQPDSSLDPVVELDSLIVTADVLER